MSGLKLNGDQKESLREGLKNGKFSKAAKNIAEDLQKKGKYEKARQLEDMGPIFDPHDFWHNQPVPKMNEVIDENNLGPIEIKTVKDVRKEEYNLPEGYRWANLDL